MKKTAYALMLLGLLGVRFLSAAEKVEEVPQEVEISWFRSQLQRALEQIEFFLTFKKQPPADRENRFLRFLFSAIDLGDSEVLDIVLEPQEISEFVLTRSHPDTGESLLDRAFERALEAEPESHSRASFMFIINNLVSLMIKSHKQRLESFVFSLIDRADYDAFEIMLYSLENPIGDLLSMVHPGTRAPFFTYVLTRVLTATPGTEQHTNLMRIINRLRPTLEQQRGSSIVLNNSSLLHDAIRLNRSDLLPALIRFGRPLFTLQVNGQTPFELAEQNESEDLRNTFRAIERMLGQEANFYRIYPVRSLEDILRQQENQPQASRPDALDGLAELFDEDAAISARKRAIRRASRVSFGSEEPNAEHPLEVRLPVPRRFSVRYGIERFPIIVNPNPEPSQPITLGEEEQHQALMREMQQEIAQEHHEEGEEQHESSEEEKLETGAVGEEVERDASFENTLSGMPVTSFPQLVILCILGLLVDIKYLEIN